MSETLKVVPVEGRTMVMHDGRRRITGVMNVPDTTYYRRAIACGDLALAPDAPVQSDAAETAKEGD